MICPPSTRSRCREASSGVDVRTFWYISKLYGWPLDGPALDAREWTAPGEARVVAVPLGAAPGEGEALVVLGVLEAVGVATVFDEFWFWVMTSSIRRLKVANSPAAILAGDVK